MTVMRVVGMCGFTVAVIGGIGAGAAVVSQSSQLQLQSDQLALSHTVDAAISPSRACQDLRVLATRVGAKATICQVLPTGVNGTKLRLELARETRVLGLSWCVSARSAAVVRVPSASEIKQIITSNPAWDPNLREGDE